MPSAILLSHHRKKVNFFSGYRYPELLLAKGECSHFAVRCGLRGESGTHSGLHTSSKSLEKLGKTEHRGLRARSDQRFLGSGRPHQASDSSMASSGSGGDSCLLSSGVDGK